MYIDDSKINITQRDDIGTVCLHMAGEQNC